MVRSKLNRKKKIKELAREQATLVPYNPSQEVISFDLVTLIDDESLRFKMVEEAGLHMPPLQP